MASSVTVESYRTIIKIGTKRLFLIHDDLQDIFEAFEGTVYEKRAEVRKSIRNRLINTFGEEVYTSVFRECEWDEVNNKPLLILVSN